MDSVFLPVRNEISLPSVACSDSARLLIRTTGLPSLMSSPGDDSKNLKGIVHQHTCCLQLF